MNPEFPEGLIKLIEEKTLTLEYVKDWTERRYAAGKLNNWDYIEILDLLREYELNA